MIYISKKSTIFYVFIFNNIFGKVLYLFAFYLEHDILIVAVG
jgi:hypothetical protein